MGKIVALHPVEGRKEELSDEALLSGCTAGDAAALAALYDRLEDDVRRCLVRLTWIDDHLVDDLVQDTFLEVFASAASFKGNASVRSWVLGITANLARKHVRGDSRRKERQRLYVERTDNRDRDPGTEAENRELVAHLQEALAELPHPQREAFVLCDVEGLSGVEAARALDIPRGTLYRRLHTARTTLREALGGDPS